MRRSDIDLLKAIGCLMVVAYHFEAVPFIAVGKYAVIVFYIRSLMSACVPLFFFSSGVLYARRELTPSSAVKKALRMLLLLLVWGMIASLFFRTLEGDVSIKGIVLDTVALRQGVTNWLWFLPVMAAVYLAAPFLTYIADRSERLFCFAVALLTIGAFGFDLISRFGTIVNFEFGSDSVSKLSDFIGMFIFLRGNHPEAIAYFAVGIWVERTGIIRRVSMISATLLLIIAPVPMTIYGLYISRCSGITYDVVFQGYSCLSTLAVVFALYAIANKLVGGEGLIVGDSPFVRAVSLVGSSSLSVYVLHWFLRPLAAQLISGEESILVGTAVGLALSLVVVFACSAVSILAGRTPIRTLLVG